MNRSKTDKQCQQGPPAVPCIQIPVSQQASYNQSSGPVQFLQDGTQTIPSMAMTNPQNSPGAFQYCGGPVWLVQHNMMQQPQQPLSSPSMYTMGKPTGSASTGDFAACQMHKPSSSLMQGVVATNGHGSMKHTEDALTNREVRLMKNRDAARESRRKKKEYVKNLESRVAMLEKEQNTLIEELRALHDIHRNKLE